MKLAKNRSLVGMIEEGCSIEGKINFTGSFRLNGEFRGDIDGDGVLLVGSKGRAEGTIRVDELAIQGLLKGRVNAKSKIEINKGGQLYADITTKSLVIEDGGIFHGKSMMNNVETEIVETEEEKILEANSGKMTSIWNKAKNS